MEIFIFELKKQENLIEEYDSKLFNFLVEKIVVKKKKEIEVHLKSGEIIS